MATNYTCPMCKNTTFHFDRSRHAVVCDVCGYSYNSAETVEEMVEYDKNRQKAIAFVRACDYASAKPHLERMRQIHPDDSDIYYLHLMGLTDYCQNLLLEPKDAQTFTLAEKYWNTFCFLRGDQQIFLAYFNRRNREKKARYDQALLRAIIIAFCCYVPLFISIALVSIEVYWFTLPTIALIAIIVCIKPASSLINLIFRKSYDK